MIHRYKINTKKDERLVVPQNTTPIAINNCHVSWETNEDGELKQIIMDIGNCPIKFDDRGIIKSNYPEIDATAFNLVSFLSNSIFTQTSVDVFDPFMILTISPELIPESDKEKSIINEARISVFSCLDAKIKIIGKFDPQDYIPKFDYSIAVAHFAAAWRSSNPFHKYESFFKVVESILNKGKNEKATDFDNRLSKYASQFDESFTVSKVENLRRLRNRCVHPDNPAHLNPEDLDSFYMIRSEIKSMERLAKLLLEKPPIKSQELLPMGIGTVIADRPSHTTRRTDRVPRRFGWSGKQFRA